MQIPVFSAGGEVEYSVHLIAAADGVTVEKNGYRKIFVVFHFFSFYHKRLFRAIGIS